MKNIKLYYRSGLNKVRLVEELNRLNVHVSLKSAKKIVDQLLYKKEASFTVPDTINLSTLEEMVDVEISENHQI